MEKPTLYIETSVVSYLTSRPSRDLIVAAHQKATSDWWIERSPDFRLLISEFVVAEAQSGDLDAAKRRLAVLDGIPSLALLPDIEEVARELLSADAVPAKAHLDALQHRCCQRSRCRLSADLELQAHCKCRKVVDNRKGMQANGLQDAENLFAA